MDYQQAQAIDWQTAKGWLKDGERKLLFELASELSPNALILNIGVEFGASLACLRAGNPFAQIVGLDLDITKAVSTYGCALIQTDSHGFLKQWQQDYVNSADASSFNRFALAFIDGDHGQLGVQLDAQYADDLVVGGYILFQDCYDWVEPHTVHRLCPGVNAAVDEWYEGHKGEFEELASVDTTRVFRRVMVVKKDERSVRISDSSNTDTNLRAESGIVGNNTTAREKPQVRRASGSTGRRR